MEFRFKKEHQERRTLCMFFHIYTSVFEEGKQGSPHSMPTLAVNTELKVISCKNWI